MAAKKFDPSKPHGTVHGSPKIAYFQDGEHFDAQGNLYVPTAADDPQIAFNDAVAAAKKELDAQFQERVNTAVAAALATQGKK